MTSRHIFLIYLFVVAGMKLLNHSSRLKITQKSWELLLAYGHSDVQSMSAAMLEERRKTQQTQDTWRNKRNDLRRLLRAQGFRLRDLGFKGLGTRFRVGVVGSSDFQVSALLGSVQSKMPYHNKMEKGGVCS